MNPGLEVVLLKQVRGLKRDVDFLAGRVPHAEWKDVQDIVRAGLASRVFEIGDQFEALYNGVPVLWDIIGIDHDTPSDPQYKHSLTIQAHDCLLNCQWDAPESLYYAVDGLTAGAYNFTYSGTTYEFTLTQPVPAGGVLTFPWTSDTDILTTKVYSYPTQASTVEIESVNIAVGSSGTALSPINDMGRCRYGSNNYLESNIRAWLNSDAASFEWAPSTMYGRPSTSAPYTGAGFLNLLDPELVAVLGAVNKQVARNTVTDGGGQDLFSDKVFLLSQVEVYAGTEGTTTGEKPYAYYSALAEAPTAAELEGRIKYLGGTARYWWLRSPNLGYSNSARSVSPAGSMSNYNTHASFGVSPACCIV